MAALILCPGMHDPQWTVGLMDRLRGGLWQSGPVYCFPEHTQQAWSAYALGRWLGSNVEVGTTLVFLGFSAGCVGAISAAWDYHYRGIYPIQAVIAMDGWGVPITGPFATYRLSHDRYTHVTSTLLGRGDRAFYAEPAVPHAEIWQTPEQVWGWSVGATRQYMTALQFLAQCLAPNPDMEKNLVNVSIER